MRSLAASLMLSLLASAAAVSAQQATPQPFPTPTTPNRPSQPTTATPSTTPPPPARPGTTGTTTGSTGSTTGTATSAPNPTTGATRAGTAQAPAAGQPATTAARGGSIAVPEPRVEEAPSEATLGHPIYPQAQFLASFDAGQGQRYYLFGTTANFTQVTTFYRGALKQRGDIVFDEPQTVMFETGRYREETMAFPPGVTVKDYTWNNSAGYINPRRGVQPERFPTVIQIVPAPGGAQ